MPHRACSLLLLFSFVVATFAAAPPSKEAVGLRPRHKTDGSEHFRQQHNLSGRLDEAKCRSVLDNDARKKDALGTYNWTSATKW